MRAQKETLQLLVMVPFVGLVTASIAYRLFEGDYQEAAAEIVICVTAMVVLWLIDYTLTLRQIRKLDAWTAEIRRRGLRSARMQRGSELYKAHAHSHIRSYGPWFTGTGD